MPIMHARRGISSPTKWNGKWMEGWICLKMKPVNILNSQKGAKSEDTLAISPVSLSVGIYSFNFVNERLI
jgi:hypothetical protein